MGDRPRMRRGGYVVRGPATAGLLPVLALALCPAGARAAMPPAPSPAAPMSPQTAASTPAPAQAKPTPGDRDTARDASVEAAEASRPTPADGKPTDKNAAGAVPAKKASPTAAPLPSRPAPRPGATGAPPPSRRAPSAPARAEAPAAAPGQLAEPAPRPTTEARIENRYATKAKLVQLYGGAQLLERGDFFNSPGVQAGATYWILEWIGIEAQVSRSFSSLTPEADKLREQLGAVPDSHAPEWLILAGARGSLGYGKMLVSGTHSTIHFEPQLFVHGGVHINDGDTGPSVNGGVGFFFYLSPRWFARLDLAAMWESEKRSEKTVNVFGVLPALVVGGIP